MYRRCCIFLVPEERGRDRALRESNRSLLAPSRDCPGRVGVCGGGQKEKERESRNYAESYREGGEEKVAEAIGSLLHTPALDHWPPCPPPL